MKTTLEIPDALFRHAKKVAAERGIPFRALASEALADKLRAASGSDRKPWMKSFGKLRDLRKETARINRIIEEEFGQLEPRVGGKTGQRPDPRSTTSCPVPQAHLPEQKPAEPVLMK